MKLTYIFLLLLTTLNVIAVPQFCRPNALPHRITREILQKGRKLLQSAARELRDAADSVKYHCPKNRLQNKLLTCTGPEIQGYDPIEYVVNCDWGIYPFLYPFRNKKKRGRSTS